MGPHNRRSDSLARRDQKKYFSETSKQGQDVNTRLANLETSEKQVIRMVQLAALFLNGVALADGVDYTPVSVPTTLLGVPTIQGIIANFWITPVDTSRVIYFGPSTETLSTTSQRYQYFGGVDTNRQLMSQLLFVAVGPDGNIKIQSTGGASAGYMTIIGYWK